MISITNTTSTGAGEAISGGPWSKVAVHVPITANGTGTVIVEGSISGDAWATIIAASTFAAATGITKTSTGNFLVSSVRARLSAWGSTLPAEVHILGA